MHCGRTIGVSSLPQQDTIFIIVPCRESMSRSTVVGVFVQKLKRFMSEAEAEVRAMSV